MNPKVSIIIPIYKTAAWLPKCVESCLNQTYDNIELILIDDGSPDNCGEICDQYAKKDARVIVIHQKNSGVSAARNAGLKRASGELISFVDSDDWIDPDMVSCMVETLLAGQYDLVISGVRKFSYEQIVLERSPTRKALCDQNDILSDLLNHKNLLFYMPVWSKLFKKSIIDEFSLHFDTSVKMGEDFPFVFDYLAHAKSCFYLEKALYNYRLITYDKSEHYQSADIEYQWSNVLIMLNSYISLYLRTGAYASFKKEADAFILRAIRFFLTRTIGAHCPRNAVILRLRTIPTSDMYEDLKSLRLTDVNGLQEKVVLVCCKYKLWALLYLCFRLRALIAAAMYERKEPKTISQIKS